jgi:hypothetical protein
MAGLPSLLISDVHARFDVVNEQLAHAEARLGGPVGEVVVLGDFGFFRDEMHRWFRRGGNRFARPVASIEGNHEDHGALAALAADYADVVTWLPRATVRPLASGRALCLGGARYMDAQSTPRGCEITDADVTACRAHAADSVDLVLTHDCPAGIGVPKATGLEHYGPPGEPRLNRLAEHFRPRWWFFGHHHRWFDGVHEETRYIGLPSSWQGYALLHADGAPDLVEHAVAVADRPGWVTLLGSWLGRKERKPG